MSEYIEHLKAFSVEGYGWFSQLIPESKWGDLPLSKDYLEKYWLSEQEYENKWKAIQERVFSSLDSSLPDLVFKQNYELIFMEGGCLFSKDDFELMQKCLLEIGEENMIVVENTFGNILKEPAFRMKYPTKITWEEITNGNFISSSIIEHPHKEFFVFGENDKWGKYSAADFRWPMDIVGYKSELSSIFRGQFEKFELRYEQRKERVPKNYD